MSNPNKTFMPHIWTVEEVDGGAIGVDTFWICIRCGASGGGIFSCFTGGLNPPSPFLAGYGGGQGALPDDCDEALVKIEDILDSDTGEYKERAITARARFERLATARIATAEDMKYLAHACRCDYVLDKDKPKEFIGPFKRIAKPWCPDPEHKETK